MLTTDLFYKATSLYFAFLAASAMLLSVWIVNHDFVYVLGFDFNVIASVQDSLNGLSIYTDPCKPPFSVSQYSPSIYYITDAIARLRGVNADQVGELVCLSRMVGFSIGVALLFGVFITLHRTLKTRLTIALILTSVFSVYALRWLALARSDGLATLMGLCAWVAVISSTQNRTEQIATRYTIKQLVLPFFFAFLAAAAKQNAAQWIVAISLYYCLLDFRKYRLAVAGLLIFGLSVTALSFLALGGEVASNVITGTANRLEFRHGFYVTHPNFWEPWGCVCVSVPILLAFLSKSISREIRLLTVSSIAIFLPLALVTGFKFGSGENYYMDVMLVSILFLGHCFSTKLNSDEERSQCKTLQDFLLCCLWFPMTYTLLTSVDTFYYSRLQSDNHLAVPDKYQTFERYDQLKAILGKDETNAGLILARNNPFTLFYPNRALFRQSEITQIMDEQGKFDRSEFQRLLASQKIRFLVTETMDQFHAPWLGCNLEDHFSFKCDASGLKVFENTKWSERNMALSGNRQESPEGI